MSTFLNKSHKNKSIKYKNKNFLNKIKYII